MLTLNNKNVIITGASSGIGQACAVLASKLSARVIFIGRNEERLRQTRALMKDGNHVTLCQDLLDYTALTEQIQNTFPCKEDRIHGLIHCAGIDMTKPFASTVPQDYRDLLEINLIAGLELSRLISKRKYVPADGASIVFISSVMASLGGIGLTAYCASKSAISSTVKAMALELAAKKIRVNSVQPGIVRTALVEDRFSLMTEAEINRIIAMHPLGLGNPMDIASLCCFLLSDMSAWITGANIPIDGGYSIS